MHGQRPCRPWLRRPDSPRVKGSGPCRPQASRCSLRVPQGQSCTAGFPSPSDRDLILLVWPQTQKDAPEIDAWSLSPIRRAHAVHRRSDAGLSPHTTLMKSDDTARPTCDILSVQSPWDPATMAARLPEVHLSREGDSEPATPCSDRTLMGTRVPLDYGSR